MSGGWPGLRIGEQYLLRPGSYLLQAQKEGYHDLEKALPVGDEKNQAFRFAMEKLPGRLAVTAHDANQVAQAISGAQILLDGEPVGITPAAIDAVRPGLRRLTVKAERYKPLQTEVDVEGMELPVLKSASGLIEKHRPVLYVENDRPQFAEALLRHIHSLGYRLYWHRPPLYSPDNFFKNPTNVILMDYQHLRN